MADRAVILIVDDEISNIEIMSAALEDHYEICFATSGEEALSTAQKVLPDLVLLDVMMPGIDGYEVCRRLKHEHLLADIPVIFTTGLDDHEAELRGLSAGAIDYVTKPVQPILLRARVANHIELKRLRDQLAEMAVTDALTGLSNRRHLEQTLKIEFQKLSKESDWLSVIMVDIDFFKLYNDTYGHPAGDRCLAMVAAALNRAIHIASDMAARYGGEEFVCILPRRDPEAAVEIAREIQSQIQLLKIPHPGSSVSPCVTVSLGVASACCSNGMAPEQWILQADEQLYLSKREGRNQIFNTIFEDVAELLQQA